MLLRPLCVLIGIHCLGCAAASGQGDAAKTPAGSEAIPEQAAHEPSPEELPGLLASQISPVVISHYSAVGGCHTIEYSGHVPKAGSVTVDWIIQPNGTVASPQVVESSFDNPQFHDCVLSVTKNFHFPEAPGTTDVSWRFKFRAPGGDPAAARQATFR